MNLEKKNELQLFNKGRERERERERLGRSWSSRYPGISDGHNTMLTWTSIATERETLPLCLLREREVKMRERERECVCV